MRNRSVTILMIVSLTMNAAVLAAAGYGYFHNSRNASAVDKHSPESAHHFFETLGLTPAQVAVIRPNAASFHKRFEILHSAMNSKKDAILYLLSGAQDDSARIEVLRQEMADIQNEIQKSVIAHVLEVKAILNADQRQRFFDLLRHSMFQEPGRFVSIGER